MASHAAGHADPHQTWILSRQWRARESGRMTCSGGLMMRGTKVGDP